MSRTYRLRHLLYANQATKYGDAKSYPARIEYDLLVDMLPWWIGRGLWWDQRTLVNELYPPHVLPVSAHPWTKVYFGEKQERVFSHRAERVTNRALLRKAQDFDDLVFVNYKHRY